MRFVVLNSFRGLRGRVLTQETKLGAREAAGLSGRSIEIRETRQRLVTTRWAVGATRWGVAAALRTVGATRRGVGAKLE
jgi:hypothetical protein